MWIDLIRFVYVWGGFDGLMCGMIIFFFCLCVVVFIFWMICGLLLGIVRWVIFVCVYFVIIVVVVEYEFVIWKLCFFICIVFVLLVEEVEVVIVCICRQVWDVNYNCFVMVIGLWGDQVCFFDDGEFFGIVGILMFEVLCCWELMDVVVVVICYFGGVKFGVGGFVCVYFFVVFEVLDWVMFVWWVVFCQVMIEVLYGDVGCIDNLLCEWVVLYGVIFGEMIYVVMVVLEFWVFEFVFFWFVDDFVVVLVGLFILVFGIERIVDLFV